MRTSVIRRTLYLFLKAGSKSFYSSAIRLSAAPGSVSGFRQIGSKLYLRGWMKALFRFWP